MEDSSGYASLIEAVENLPQDGVDGEPLYGEQYRGRRFSPAALERLRAFAEQMRVLRAGLSEDLGTLLYEIERTMLLDIELAVRPGTDRWFTREPGRFPRGGRRLRHVGAAY